MTQARTLTRASAALPCLLAGLLLLIAGLSPHATAAVRDLPPGVASAHHGPLAAAQTIQQTGQQTGPRAVRQTAALTDAPAGARERAQGDRTAQSPASPHAKARTRTGPGHAAKATGHATGQPAAMVITAERAGAEQSCKNHDPVQGPLHASHLRLRGTVTDNRPQAGPDWVTPPYLNGDLTVAADRPRGFDARPRCLTRRTAARISALLQVFRC